jgi:hypothetical protein
MTSTNVRIGGVRKEVDYQKLGPALLIASSLVLAIRTARWPATHSDGLADVDWQKEVEHSARVAKVMLTHLTSRFPNLFTSRDARRIREICRYHVGAMWGARFAGRRKPDFRS